MRRVVVAGPGLTGCTWLTPKGLDKSAQSTENVAKIVFRSEARPMDQGRPLAMCVFFPGFWDPIFVHGAERGP